MDVRGGRASDSTPNVVEHVSSVFEAKTIELQVNVLRPLSHPLVVGGRTSLSSAASLTFAKRLDKRREDGT